VQDEVVMAASVTEEEAQKIVDASLQKEDNIAMEIPASGIEEHQKVDEIIPQNVVDNSPDHDQRVEDNTKQAAQKVDNDTQEVANRTMLGSMKIIAKKNVIILEDDLKLSIKTNELLDVFPPILMQDHPIVIA